MLDRFFGECGIGGGCGWWIIVLFFLFLAFQECWQDFDICTWIPFLILLLIVCGCGFDGADDGCCC
ncbi:hypothetical protein CHL78_010445 [Romboutsia weinsteinii]|uniref:Uncharacterized protein n=1 Tax=Romboutsia weinsteinii TaxID=2020949 RepID=A0A371J3B7_9FIRM|nr:hypothetical protein [Romboutsia weinsteinii]RDY27203.1 hypothetical protein CHL78_010445 [Romboutsia weinsteinii]